jgi:glycosyltransferase involved in cell wall biosynthesis
MSVSSRLGGQRVLGNHEDHWLRSDLGSRVRVLSVAFPFMPVEAGSAGGAEQILWLLERTLVARGGMSWVVAAQGSQVSGTLIQTAAPPPEITDEALSQARDNHSRAILHALSAQSFELIHFHGLDFYSYRPDHSTPMLATLHLPIAWYPPSIFNVPNMRLVCVSRSQAASAPKGVRLPIVENGIDTSRYGGCEKTREDFLLWLGRVCPEKGTDIALQIAHKLGLRLIVAGRVHAFPSHQKYFDTHVAPLLDTKREFVGPVGLNEKAALLARARGLLVPSLVAETSSLVAMEAVASGTPVIAFRSGALPEIIEHGRTGFIVDGSEEMAEAVQQLSAISATTCRQVAASRFSVHRMLNDYLRLYKDLVGPNLLGMAPARP